MRWSARAIWVAGFAASALFLGKSLSERARLHSQSIVAEKLGAVRPVDNRTLVSCEGMQVKQPLVILALGQSNAGNHGELALGYELIDIIAGDQCARVQSPLPGGTGNGGSIWSHLPHLMRAGNDLGRPIAISVLAVDATSIADWTSPHSPLAARLILQVQQLKRLGLSPDAVVWQQGEADARMGTSKKQYIAGLKALSQTVRSAGASAPIFLGRSTICRSPVSQAVHLAVSDTLKDAHGFMEGADTDTLIGAKNRMDGCHFTATGQYEAARLWAAAIRAGLKL